MSLVVTCGRYRPATEDKKIPKREVIGVFDKLWFVMHTAVPPFEDSRPSVRVAVLGSPFSFLPSQGALVGLYADKRYKSGDDEKKDLPLQSIEIIGGEVRHCDMI